jgi:hypothetical protein
MKTKKFLATLLCLPLLAGCGNNVKAPKFAEYGKELNYADYMDATQKKTEASVLKKSFNEKKMESFEGKGSSASFSSSEIVRNKKSIYKNQSSSNATTVVKYDANASTFRTDEKSNNKQTTKDNFGSKTSGTKKNDSSQMQIDKVKDKYYLIEVEFKKSEYKAEDELAKEADGKPYIDGYMKELVLNSLTYIDYTMAMMIGLYNSFSDDVKSRFKFYQNDNIFTVEYKHKTENEEYKPADKLISVENGEYKNILQIDLTENAWNAKYYQNKKVTTEYKENFDTSEIKYAKGDVLTEISQTSTQYSFAKKDVKQQKADISKFVAVGFGD